MFFDAKMASQLSSDNLRNVEQALVMQNSLDIPQPANISALIF